jgi:Tfp pilus assembly protein PilX
MGLAVVRFWVHEYRPVYQVRRRKGLRGEGVRGRRGIALLNVLMFTVVTTVFLVVGIQFTQSAVRQGRKSNGEAQVYNVAMAGMNHAISWFQAHEDELPTVFDPKADSSEPDEDPETMATEEQLGLVQEFIVDAQRNLWGRYEVARSTQAPIRDDVTATGSRSPLYTNPPAWTAEDISAMRGGLAGTIWRVRCRAYLFERTSPTQPFSLTSPKPIQTATVEAEVRRSHFNFPKAAIYSYIDGASGDNQQITVSEADNGSNTQVVIGDGAADHLIANTDEAKLKISNQKQVALLDSAGNYAPAIKMKRSNFTSSDYVDPVLGVQLKDIFGVDTIDALKLMVDKTYTDVTDTAFPASSFVYINPTGKKGELKLKTPLSGGGILFVDGDLVMDTKEPSTWEGVIFVTGNYKQNNATVTGQVIVGGEISELKGAKNAQAKIVYSKNVIDRITGQFSTFRLDRATIKVVESSGTTKTY